MLKLRRIIDLSSPLLLCLVLCTGALAQDNQAAKKTEAVEVPGGGSMVTGRAIYEDTGQPATRERVQLIESEALINPPPKRLHVPTAITNQQGEFSLRHIAAGEYYVIVLPVDEHGQSFPIPLRPGDSAEEAKAKLERFKKDHIRITVDDQHNLEVNLRVPNPHFGIISGRVLDPAGKPAVGASVHLMNRGDESFGASALTDEQGQYRFFGLPAGEYIIGASPPAKGRDEGASSPGFQGLPGATYFPSTLDSRNSPPVTVFPDRDTGNIEVTLIARSLHSLSGTVRTRGDHRPVNNAMVRLSRKEIADQPAKTPRTAGIESVMSDYLIATDKSGRWTIANVPDGRYSLSVQPREAPPTMQMQPFVRQEQDLTVEGADVEDLLVEVSEGSSLSGVVTLEGQGAVPQSIMVQATRHQGNANSVVRLDEPGKFALPAVPAGEILLSAFPLPQDKFYVKSIEANGLDLLRTSLTIIEGEEIKDVRIVISPNVGVVTGRVLSLTDDKPIAGINVLLRRVQDDKLRLFGGKLAGVTDDRGNFTLSAAPGVYLVLAWRASNGPSAYADAMNRALREQGPGLTLSPNERKQLDIRVP